MAKVAKYQIDFKSGDNQDCQITFLYEGWAGGITTLEGGAKPFVLREFNSDDDIFKPIRAMMAEMQIVTNVNGVQIEDFYANQDSDILIRFSINTFPYWRGYVLQDDFQEVWDDSNHYLIIRAADGFGLLKNFQFGDGDNELVGRFTPFDCLSYAMNRLPETPLIQHYVINNLYHDSMSDAVQTMPLDQCYIDAKTFQQEATTYDNCYTAIEKINKSFSQTVFMYMGEWWFLRVEELYTSYNNNLRGFFSDLGVRYTIDRRYDIEIGINREIKPISPEMLRLIQKKTKYDQVKFSYEPFNEMLLNETFARGTFVSSTPTSKTYSIEDWTFEYNTIDSPLVPPSDYKAYIREVFISSTAGGLLERYVYMEYTGAGAYLEAWLKSSSFKVFSTNVLKFSVDVRQFYIGTNDFYRNQRVAYVIIESGGLYAWLNEEGNWTIETNLIDCEPIRLNTLDSGIDQSEWNSLQIDSDLMPFGGTISCRLNMVPDNGRANSITYFKNLEFKVMTSFESGDNVRRITGIESKFEKTGTIINASEKESFLDDHYSTVHKGAIFQSDAETLTDQDWYRYRFLGESYGFRRQNDTAYWEHNRFNRNKIDGNFYGIMWNDGAQDQPIGLINTIRFLDDDVNKVYWIANLREIDFAAGTWSATLEEVYDELRDTPVSSTFEADFTIGTYASPSILPLTIVTAGGFSIQGGNTARYDGATTLSTPIDCSIFGEVSASTYPKTISFQLQKNGTAIKTINYPIYVANQPYTLNMSVGAQSIATNDTFRLVVVGASSINVDGGDIKINSPSPTQNFDTYTDNYLYQ